jgi:hypothetical protein
VPEKRRCHPPPQAAPLKIADDERLDGHRATAHAHLTPRNQCLNTPNDARKLSVALLRGVTGIDGAETLEKRGTMDGSRKPLARVEGRRRLRVSGVTVAWRGTREMDDWVAYIVNGTRSRKLILADHSCERKVKTLMARLQTLSRKEIEKLAKG